MPHLRSTTEEISKIKISGPVVSVSASPSEALALPTSDLSSSSAGIINRIRNPLSVRPNRMASCEMRASTVSRVQIGTDILDFRSFPGVPQPFIADYICRIKPLLPGNIGDGHACDPRWQKYVLDKALIIANDTCPLVLKRRSLTKPHSIRSKCALLASLIPARYFPKSGTVVDRFFTGLISFLKRGYLPSIPHAMRISKQQGTLDTITTARDGRRGRSATSRPDNAPRRKERRPARKASRNESVTPRLSVIKQHLSACEYASQISPKKRRNNMTKIPSDNLVQIPGSRKRKSLDKETQTEDGKKETTSTEDRTPPKRKKVKAARGSIESALSPALAPPPERQMAIKVEDSSDEGSHYEVGPRKKRINVYETMYHNAQEDIRFFERLIWHGAGISKTDIDASKTRVAMGQTYRQAFDHVYKPPETRSIRRPKAPGQK